MKHVIVGTAGHIDHGKSALVRALTGTDPDRLEEEKRRGITIDIGFATLDLGGEYRLGFVDVPGHERFVKNMLAGISGIDLLLFVVAADESIQPQTREHFDICRLLDVRKGIVVLTKADLVEPDILDLVKLEMEEFVRGSFLEGAPVLAVSSRTGDGLDRLKEELRRAGSLLLRIAAECAVPAGQALAVDRARFAAGITAAIEQEQRIRLRREEVREIPSGSLAIVATGPLTSDALAGSIQCLTGSESLFFCTIESSSRNLRPGAGCRLDTR